VEEVRDLLELTTALAADWLTAAQSPAQAPAR
jgi:hypothetical protein